MAQAYLFLKVKVTAKGTYKAGHETLSGALRSEGLFHLYHNARRRILRSGKLEMGGLTIEKIPKFH